MCGLIRASRRPLTTPRGRSDEGFLLFRNIFIVFESARVYAGDNCLMPNLMWNGQLYLYETGIQKTNLRFRPY